MDMRALLYQVDRLKSGWRFLGQRSKNIFRKGGNAQQRGTSCGVGVEILPCIKAYREQCLKGLARSNGYACFVVLSLQATKAMRQHIATPLAPLLRSKPCQCLPSCFGEHKKTRNIIFLSPVISKGCQQNRDYAEELGGRLFKTWQLKCCNGWQFAASSSWVPEVNVPGLTSGGAANHGNMSVWVHMFGTAVSRASVISCLHVIACLHIWS